MAKALSFKQAIQRAAKGDKSTLVIQAIFNATEGGALGDPGSFYDWLAEGEYDGTETPQSICAEANEYHRQATEL